MTVKASANGLKVSPRKLGEVAALVRNRSVADAQTILEHTPRRAARLLKKVIDSAQANATGNHKVEGDLFISSLLVGPGPVIKRYRAHSRLNVRPIRHRLSNVKVELEQAVSTKPAATAAKSKQPSGAKK